MMSKKTLIITISLFVIVGMIPFVNFTTAHNPQLVEAWYERNTWSTSIKFPEVEEPYFEEDTIFVIITHDVTEPDVHFVDEIHIELIRTNGSENLHFTFTEQENISMNEYHFPGIVLEVGDEIHVTAYCNFEGSFSTHMFVGEPFEKHETKITEAFIPSIIITILILIPLGIIAIKDSSKQKRAIKSAIVDA